MLLYDLTSSYVEGAAEKDPMMRRGYSRDHRPDCKQVVIALIVNVEGFPLSYETFDGNRADVTTLEDVLRMVERKYGQARRVWVFDRGIVSEENLEALRRRGGQYLVGTPRAKLKQFEAVAERRLGAGAARGGSETGADPAARRPMYCVAPPPAGRRNWPSAAASPRAWRRDCSSGQAGRERPTQRPQQDGAAVGEHAGTPSAGGGSVRCGIAEARGPPPELELREERRAWRKPREGAYVLRTNLPASEPEQLWKSYIQLDGSGGGLSCAQERTLHPPAISTKWNAAPRRTSWWPSWATPCG